ncbi:sugar ABC transporter substrate-binding protein [Anaerostipes sp.]|uniref:sugar ABC transporter substrate-binding protein n=1 Tax=Anaerostipes sp. TaxID=1872530 RepID=UPI00258AE3EA|nr:sugar ABC transporter substrate-binding protein [Anaerostipes sp.]MCI5622565.1 sugar ABC transporter substrate-binding protein [Anaerostipes sp.]MDY2725566.1 sugar ABC transporter substrate-binding protein [Anaerostipes faecalis]
MDNNEKQKWKKRFGVGIVISFFCLFLLIYMKTYISYSQQYGKHRRVFGATYMTMNNQFYKIVNNEIQMQIEKKGDQLITLDPALDQKKQNEQIKYLVKKKVDVIFLNPVDWKKVKSGLQAAKKAGIPVIVIDTPVYNEELVDMTVVSDNYKAGVQCAKDMMKKKNHANIVLLTHTKTKSGVDRIQGFLDAIDGHSQYQVIASADTEGQIERSLPKVEKIIKDHEDIDVIMALNDPAAMGALAALDSEDYQRNVLVYGVDGSPEAKKLIKERMMTGTSAQFPKQMGDTAIESAYQLLDGKKISKNRIIPVKMITEKNIDQFDINRW